MASFFSFVYKRPSSSAGPSYDSNSGGETTKEEDVENARQFLHPGVSSSNSSDTAWGSLQLSQDDDEFVHATTTCSDDTDDLFVSPFTPDGLLPRKSADSLRRELNVPRVLEHSLGRAQGRQEPLSRVAKILSDKNSIPPFRTENHFDKGILPPPPDCLLNRPSFDSSIQSPPVSTSSFYSRNTCSESRIAMSPVLQVGQARTAVGALVALREAANHHSNATSALPPFPTEKMHEKVLDKNQSFVMKALPPRSDFMAYPDNDDNSEAPSENENDIPYLALDENNDKTPDRRRRSDSLDSVLYASPSSMQPAGYCRSKGNSNTEEVDTSFSSRADLIRKEHRVNNSDIQQGLATKNDVYDFHPIIEKPSTPESSISDKVNDKSHQEEVEHNEEAMGDNADHFYDFNEDTFDEALMRRKYRNQQQAKLVKLNVRTEPEEEQIPLPEEDCESRAESFEDGNCLEEKKSEDIDACALKFDSYGECETTNKIDFEEALLGRKSRNQRHEKEKYLMEVVARLRDNLDLVADVQTAAGESVAAEGTWFANIPLDSENLLTGFSSQQRHALLNCLDGILKEMEIVQPEEVFMSPSQIPVIATKHDTLCQALVFCRNLVYTAVPKSEREKLAKNLPSKSNDTEQQLFVWKCLPELRAAMGILPPQSPDTVRGGGTSLFSLPGESVADTPHTSNVSLATSITSANPRSSSMKPQLILQQDGLQLRHTTAIVSSLLQKLNISCQQLNSLNASSINKKAKTYVRACEEIKQNYLQMLAIEKGDFRALMEAFHLDLLSPKVTTTISLVREVSTDEEDQLVPRSTRWHRNIQTLEWASSLAVQPIPEDLHQGELRNPFDGADTSLPSHNASFERRDSNIGQDRPDLFSPSTEDMRSWSGDKNAVPYEYDDLRRQFGSYDRDDGCEDELRDGPCCDFEEPREGSAEWQRMYHNVSLAASSIRSEEKFLKGRDE